MKRILALVIFSFCCAMCLEGQTVVGARQTSGIEVFSQPDSVVYAQTDGLVTGSTEDIVADIADALKREFGQSRCSKMATPTKQQCDAWIEVLDKLIEQDFLAYKWAPGQRQRDEGGPQHQITPPKMETFISVPALGWVPSTKAEIAQAELVSIARTAQKTLVPKLKTKAVRVRITSLLKAVEAKAASGPPRRVRAQSQRPPDDLVFKAGAPGKKITVVNNGRAHIDIDVPGTVSQRGVVFLTSENRDIAVGDEDPRLDSIHSILVRIAKLEAKVKELEARPTLTLRTVDPATTGTLVKRAHAQKPKAAVLDTASAPIPVPEPEAAQLKASVEEFQQKVKALEAQYEPQWKLILARAGMRAKLLPEQLDKLSPSADGKGGFHWVPKVNQLPTMPKEK